MSHSHEPAYMWPAVALVRVVAVTLEWTGRLVALVLGGVFVLVGALLTATVFGAVIGLPLMAIGLLLVARGLF